MVIVVVAGANVVQVVDVDVEVVLVVEVTVDTVKLVAVTVVEVNKDVAPVVDVDVDVDILEVEEVAIVALTEHMVVDEVVMVVADVWDMEELSVRVEIVVVGVDVDVDVDFVVEVDDEVVDPSQILLLFADTKSGWPLKLKMTLSFSKSFMQP